jgi:hypothetical protein
VNEESFLSQIRIAPFLNIFNNIKAIAAFPDDWSKVCASFLCLIGTVVPIPGYFRGRSQKKLVYAQ